MCNLAQLHSSGKKKTKNSLCLFLLLSGGVGDANLDEKKSLVTILNLFFFSSNASDYFDLHSAEVADGN